jgi:dipeptidyl aminopeptidase/acylaminoacyl peptidase
LPGSRGDIPTCPWDETELWVAAFGADGGLVSKQQVAGGSGESVFQPAWSPDGTVHFVSDRREGWWNLYRWRGGQIEPLCELDAEFGMPQWAFGMSTYGFESATRVICAYTEDGIWRLARLDTRTQSLVPIDTPYTAIASVQVSAGQAVFTGGSPTEPNSVVRLDLSSGKTEALRRAIDVRIDPDYISRPEPITFSTEGGQSAHAFYYLPRNPHFAAPAGEKPPLIVLSHGGPTSAATSVLNLTYQYWTSRGFALVDVNYGGSTGYGRAYRERLYRQWGVVDVDDCVNAARYLVERGLASPDRLIIAGGSAGGYTTLCALTFRDLFKAGASYFGLSDLEGDLLDTHKFESRYSVPLVGRYPEEREVYYQRSPIHFAERISSPMIFFQGLDDKVVLPGQSEKIVEVLRAKRLPVAYIAFAGEGHGFRRAANIKRTLDAELYFYSRVFGFPLADPIEPVEIENLVQT